MADKKLIEHALGILAKSAPRKVVTDPAERAANLKNFLGPTPEEIATSKWYHGTAREVPNFTNDKPTFVTTSPKFANAFAEQGGINHDWDDVIKKWVPRPGSEIAPNVMPLHVRAENPWDHTNPDHVQAVLDRLYEYRPLETNSDRMRLMHGDWENIEMPYIQREIKGLGHDAFFVNEGGERNLAVYNPANQLKSATGNAGTFDPDIPRLEEASGGKTVSKALKAVSEMFDSPGMTQWREKSVIPASRVEDRYFTGTSKDKDFPSFNVGRHGAWFTKDPAEASSYAKENDSKGFKAEGWKMVPVNTADRVIPAYLRAENPFTGPRPESVMSENYKKAQSDWFDQLRAQGHDAWMPESAPDLAVILKDPSQIKSAISNSGDFDLNAPRTDRAHGGTVEDALHAVRRHFDGEDGSYVDPEEPRPLTIYRGKVPVADEAGGSGREPTPAPPAFSYMPTPESVARQAARQPAYNPADHRWSDAGSTEGERLTRALGVEGELPKGETTMSAAPTGWERYMPQRRPGSYMKRWGEAFNENADAVEEGIKAIRAGNYGSGALGMVGGGLGMAMSPLTGMERVLVRDPILQYTGDLKKAQQAEMVADTVATGGVRGMVTPFAKAGSLERMATEPWNRVRMPSPGAAGAATAAGAMLAPEDAEASKLSKAMEVARMAIPRELSPLGFYSHGAEAARGLSQAKGTPQQFASMLNTAGVKGPEMESYLKTFGGRPIVTKDEIAQHFQDTMPQITERVSGGARTPMSDEAFKANLDDLYDKFLVQTNRYPKTDAELREWAETQSASPTRFGQYSTPGGEDYREVRLMAPLHGGETFQSSHWPGDENVIAHYRRKTMIGPNNERIMLVDELQSDLAQKAGDLRNDEVKRVMEEQGIPKEEANKIVPSDFGFKKPADPEFEAKVGAAEDAYNEAANSHQELLKQINQSIEKMPDPRTMSIGDYNRAQQAHEAMRQDVMRANPDFGASIGRVRQTSQDLTDLRRQQRAIEDAGGVPMGPYVGNTQQWTDLLLKRIFKDAVDNGYDKIAFTQGAEQAKRYSLSNQVNSIDYMREGDDAYRLGIVDKQGEAVDLPQSVFTAKELEQYLGKDVANKIVNDEGKAYRGRNHKSIEGLDLTVGGKGMLGYYDGMVPKRFQLLAKTHDPKIKVGQGHVSNLAPGDSWPYSAQIESNNGQYWVAGRHPDQDGIVELSPRFGSFREADTARDLIYRGYTQPVHEISVTPEFRESVGRGQPDRARGGEVVDQALHAVRRHFAGDEGSYVDPMGSVAIPEAREPSDEPSLVDRAMNFVSQFNPVGSAEAASLKFPKVKVPDIPPRQMTLQEVRRIFDPHAGVGMSGEDLDRLVNAYGKVASPASLDDELARRGTEIAQTYITKSGSGFGGRSFFGHKPSVPIEELGRAAEPVPYTHEPKAIVDKSWQDVGRERAGSPLISLGGDLSDLVRLRGYGPAGDLRALSSPTDIHAGFDYMLEPNLHSVWSNNPEHAAMLEKQVLGQKEIQRAVKKDLPVMAVANPMGPGAIDSAKNMMDLYLNAIEGAAIHPEYLRKATEDIRSGAFGGSPKEKDKLRKKLADFPGFDDMDKAREFLLNNPDVAGTTRSAIIKGLEKADLVKKGFPEVGQLRVAASSPKFMMAPGNMMGGRMIELDPRMFHQAEANRYFKHFTYGGDTPGTYYGDVPLIHRQYGAPDVTDMLMSKYNQWRPGATKSAPPKAPITVHPFSLDQGGRDTWRKMFEEQRMAQPINERMMESIMRGEQRRPLYGFAKGGVIEDHALAAIYNHC